MEIILTALFNIFKIYCLVGCIFTLLTAVIAFSTGTENEYKIGEILAMILFYPLIIYYLLNPEKNDYGQ
jgi:hypothetical protein